MSKRGFHPCDYQTYLKLKMLHKRYWQTKRAFAEWKRWQRKLPKNRVIRKWLRDANGRKIGHEIIGPLPETTYCPTFVRNANPWWGDTKDWGIVQTYQQARMPVSKEKVKPLALSVMDVEKLHQEVEDWFSKK
jgi:hypothetical protein